MIKNDHDSVENSTQQLATTSANATAVTPVAMTSRQHQDSTDGIGFNLAAALVDVTAIDCTGSALFDQMRL